MYLTLAYWDGYTSNSAKGDDDSRPSFRGHFSHSLTLSLLTPLPLCYFSMIYWRSFSDYHKLHLSMSYSIAIYVIDTNFAFHIFFFCLPPPLCYSRNQQPTNKIVSTTNILQPKATTPSEEMKVSIIYCFMSCTVY